MIPVQSIISSIAIGTIVGLLYGLSFLNKVKKAHSPFLLSINIFLRLVTISFLFYYLLSFKIINSIIVMLFFLMSFWFLILKKERII